MAFLHYSFVKMHDPVVEFVDAGTRKYIALKCTPTTQEGHTYHGYTYNSTTKAITKAVSKDTGPIVIYHSCHPSDPYKNAFKLELNREVYFLSAYAAWDSEL